MAEDKFKAVYIGSDDYWGYDADTFNEETNFFGEAWIVDGNQVTQKVDSYLEIQLFKRQIGPKVRRKSIDC